MMPQGVKDASRNAHAQCSVCPSYLELKITPQLVADVRRKEGAHGEKQQKRNRSPVAHLTLVTAILLVCTGVGA